MEFPLARRRMGMVDCLRLAGRRAESAMSMPDEICAKRDEIHATARRFKAERLWDFGLYASKAGRPDGDMGFSEKFNDLIGSFKPCRCERDMSDEVGRKVDLFNMIALGRSVLKLKNCAFRLCGWGFNCRLGSIEACRLPRTEDRDRHRD